jgi:hypothetical protein
MEGSWHPYLLTLEMDGPLRSGLWLIQSRIGNHNLDYAPRPRVPRLRCPFVDPGTVSYPAAAPRPAPRELAFLSCLAFLTVPARN